jgi:MFS transporter, FLVCR family, MFS-domain-containing protein 7
MTTNDQTTPSTSEERAPTPTTSTNVTATVMTKADAPTGWIGMKALGRVRDDEKNAGDKNPLQISETGATTDYGNLVEVRSNDALIAEEGGRNPNGQPDGEIGEIEYKVYKRRFFGFFQLTMLNIIGSWDWLSWSAVSTTSAEYYGVSTTAISWLSSSYLFAFVVICPFTMYVLHRGGPRPAIIIAAVFILLGNWIRYGGTKANNFGAVMFGQILTGVAQPFVLSAPTRYSDLWFSEKGRVTATAVMTLANPFGGALGQLIDPFLSSSDPNSIPDMVLYIAIIVSSRSLS